MSLPRIRKVVASEDGPRARGSVAKASGDVVACTVRTNPEPLRSRSKNKIPKSVRYDLENALVSLCDVWFEEIKPHLVRNNIKLHVHGSHAGGECGDHERVPVPEPAPSAAAPGCSHLDPGAASDHHPRRSASCAGCCSTLPTASRARCARLHMPSRRPLSPLLSVPHTPHECAQTQSHDCEEKKPERPRNRRRHRRSQVPAQAVPSRRVPRLCRTYRAQAAGATTLAPPSPPRDHYFQFIVPRHVMKNKSTQTKQALSSVSKGCQSDAPRSPRSPVPQGMNSRNRAATVCSPRSSDFRSSIIRCEISSRSNPRNLSSHSPDPSPGTRTQGSISPKTNPMPTSRDCAPAEPSLPRLDIRRLNRSERTVAVDLPLFQDDLIDIIGESNDKRLRLLCSSTSSPEREDHPSCMHLSLNDRQARPGGLKKIPPWR